MSVLGTAVNVCPAQLVISSCLKVGRGTRLKEVENEKAKEKLKKGMMHLGKKEAPKE